ncbi:MAG: DUF881 domain-containing protein [Peptostreptococcaceae bacterium]|nr:DUF881 domain-containing protein [Peptostreptococcaceae bacterium]
MGTLRNRRRNFLILASFVIGVVLMLQFRSLKDSTVFYSRETIRELELELALEESEAQKQDDYLLRKQEELLELSRAKDEKNLQAILEKQHLLMRASAGRTNFEGMGIRIEIRDSDIDILPGQNPNDYIVHDQDVLRMVNDLKTAGAEVISINNQIYTLGTEIKCSGPTITINGKTFGQPFVIRAIGDPEPLEAAIKSKESYSYMISSLFGIKIDTSKEERIFIHGSMEGDLIYLEEANEE